jgi:hypothetical protein
LEKISVVGMEWVSYEEIISTGTGYDDNVLRINATSQIWSQNIEESINRDVIKENKENFVDPLNWHPYPFAYAYWSASWTIFNFVQLAYVEEITGSTRLIWDYYEVYPWDSLSLFVNELWEEVEEYWKPIYDIWVKYLPPEWLKKCNSGKQVWNYSIPAGLNKGQGRVIELTRSESKYWEWWVDYITYRQRFVCNNWEFFAQWEETQDRPVCLSNYALQKEAGVDKCILIWYHFVSKNRNLITGAKSWWPNPSVTPIWTLSSRSSPNYWRNFDITNNPAFKACADLWIWWRLPNKNELLDLCQNWWDEAKNYTGSGNNDRYWSSTVKDLTVFFGYNCSDSYHPNTTYGVICIHD